MPPPSPKKPRRLTLDGVPSVDVRKWPRSGLLVALSPFAEAITFVVDAVDLARTRRLLVGVTIKGRNVAAGVEVELAYPNNAVGTARSRVFTYLNTTIPRFGGQRLWIICPQCKTRAAVLYFFNDVVRCARCARHIRLYGRQLAAPRSQHLRHAIELRRKIGADDHAWEWELQRPKRMHRKTFERIVDRIESHERQALLLAYRKHFRGRL